MPNPAEVQQEPEPTSSLDAVLEKSQPPSASRFHEGLVIAIAHGYFEVACGPEVYLCTLRGRLRKPRPQPAPRLSTQKLPRFGHPTRPPAAQSPAEEQPPARIAPGERVLFSPLGGGQGIIEEVLPRRTALSRARSETGAEHVMLANLDHAVLVFAVQEPSPHFGMLDRYLALCEHAGIAATICLNKVDLGVPAEVQDAGDLYAGLGYRVLFTSAATGEGVAALRGLLLGRTSLLTGPSGVGKSSLMNDLIPGAAQRTAEISEATGKGRHTTTGVRLLPLPDSGWLADSAGIRELALWNVPADALPRAFVELRPFADDCEYEDCGHSEGEVGCALREALAHGMITPERFASFERLLAEACDAEEPRW